MSIEPIRHLAKTQLLVFISSRQDAQLSRPRSLAIKEVDS